MTWAKIQDKVVKIQKKSTQAARASWLLETTGSRDAACFKAECEEELALLFKDPTFFEMLSKERGKTPLQERERSVLLLQLIPYQVPEGLTQALIQTETELASLDARFRTQWQGQPISDGGVKDLLRKEKGDEIRRSIWNASKEVGQARAPYLMRLVSLRNEAAQILGYPDYFTMQLELQEVDRGWLSQLMEEVLSSSEVAYSEVVKEILEWSSQRYGVHATHLQPHFFTEPFCQEDPIDTDLLDTLVSHVNLEEAVQRFFSMTGADVSKILAASDMEERPFKNPHAFCTHIDREGDIRTLNNLRPTLKWLETLLHELGHAIYEQGLDQSLPWSLRTPPHMMTTEAIALLFGRQAYRSGSLDLLVGSGDEKIKQQAEASLRRRQLIFARFALTMTAFEQQLYQNPHQDLQSLWWKMVEKYQRIHSPGSSWGHDFAAKFHIALAPVYYYSYLLGELFASHLEKQFFYDARGKLTLTGLNEHLRSMLFCHGNSAPWDELVKKITGEPLRASVWTSQFL